MPTALQSRALTFVAELGHDRTVNQKIATIREIRNSYPREEWPELRDVKDAVEWALAQPRDFSQYLTDWQNTPSYWRQYTFPNGRGANIEVDPNPKNAFRFVVEYDGEDGMFTAPGLSTSEVEAKLAAIAALPAIDDERSQG